MYIKKKRTRLNFEFFQEEEKRRNKEIEIELKKLKLEDKIDLKKRNERLAVKLNIFKGIYLKTQAFKNEKILEKGLKKYEQLNLMKFQQELLTKSRK